MRIQQARNDFAKFMGHEQLQIADWLYGLVAAIIGGGANAVVGGVTINMIDPRHFNAQNFDFYKIVGAMFLANAFISMFMYLKQKPLPAIAAAPDRQVFEPTAPDRQVFEPVFEPDAPVAAPPAVPAVAAATGTKA